MELLLRDIKTSDARAYLELMHQLDDETKFMLFEPGERDLDIEAQEKKLQQIKNDPFSKIFVAEEGEDLVGFIAVFGSKVTRIKHRASIVIGILQAYSGKGIGKRLFKKAEDWAIENGMTRLELTVMTHNKRALWLYSSVGFNVEGIRRKALIVDGDYIDEFYMSKIL